MKVSGTNIRCALYLKQFDATSLDLSERTLNQTYFVSEISQRKTSIA